jgi:hypothetical protein
MKSGCQIEEQLLYAQLMRWDITLTLAFLLSEDWQAKQAS